MAGDERHDLSSVDIGGREGPHAPSVAQNSDAIDQPRDFVQSVADIDDSDLLALELADQIEQARRLALA